MDDSNPPSRDLRKTMETIADEAIHTAADDVTIPDFVETEHDVPTLPPGTRIGKYTIETVLGVGGMGAVYRATQNKPQRKVALKLIRPGVLSSKSIRRFDLEAEILGRLHHPNIAQIHEAGIDSDSGSPYFAMEYVDGVELGDYARDQKLDKRACLEIFVKLCNAIQHAHSKGIIHRDLKPANVLVDPDGEPKVLDFGVARATDSTTAGATMQTNVGQLIGTLFYMSPEQAVGDTMNLDTRSDVYALGVVLYEILTGKIPYDLDNKAIHEAVRIIHETNPTKLSRHDQSLSGDIEIIVGKALDKEKDRRYQSAADLSADITRLLKNEPISARPPSMIYKSSKFVRRNTGVTVAAACILILFSIGSGFAITQWVRRIEARRLALDNMLTTLNEMDVQKGLGPDLAKRLLDLYSEHGETIFSGDQESLAVFFTNLGEAYLGYEDYHGALSSFVKAHSIRERGLSAPNPLLANSILNVGRAQFFLQNFDQAKDYYEQNLEMRQQLYTPSDPESGQTARTMDHLGSIYVRLKDNETAYRMYIKARDLRVEFFGKESIEYAMSINSIGLLYSRGGEYEKAEKLFLESMNVLNSLPEADAKPKWLAQSMQSLGTNYIHRKMYPEAIDSLANALQLKITLLGPNSPGIAKNQQMLAEAYYHIGQYGIALEHIQEALRIRELDGSESAIQATQRVLEVIKAKATSTENPLNSG